MGKLGNRPRGKECSRGGFSLIDLLVSIAVMVILLAILAPALRMAHESARRVACASNVRQMGLALEMYVEDFRDHLPPAQWDEPPTMTEPTLGRSGQGSSVDQDSESDHVENDGADTMFLRYPPTSSNSNQPVWDGLGLLVSGSYLNHPGVFYCPSHHGDHPYEQYAGEWTTGAGTIAGNYQYRIPPESRFLSELDRRTALIADGMRTRQDYNHINGNNFLRADLSVGWFSDVGGVVYASLPDPVVTQPSIPGTQSPTPNDPWDEFDESN